METEDLSDNACTVCGKAATTRCAGCKDPMYNNNDLPTYYCGQTCQLRDRPAHKKGCQAAEARKRLFRAGELMQEAYLAIRAEVFGGPVVAAGWADSGRLIIWDGPDNQLAFPGPIASWLNRDPTIKRTILSYQGDGPYCGDLYSDIVCQLGLTALKDSIKTCEEINVLIPTEQVMVIHHPLHDQGKGDIQRTHVTMFVKLKDNSAWAIDWNGPQIKQFKPVPPLSEFQQKYGTKVYSRRKIPSTFNFIIDEIYEWEFQHGTVTTLLKSHDAEYQRLQPMLVEHLAAAAREYRKLQNGDPTSQAKPFALLRDRWAIDMGASMSGEDKLKYKRQNARFLEDTGPGFIKQALARETEVHVAL